MSFDEEEYERLQVLKMMSPETWPFREHLPVKRIHQDGTAEFGIILVGLPFVYIRDPENTIFGYSSFESLVEDGWRVD